MASPANINARIIEGLYCEALILADEVRAAINPAPEPRRSAIPETTALALSCEGLRTTTRMMQAVAWLLNHRAYLAGNLSELQLRRYGKLHPCPEADSDRFALLDPALQDLIRATELFYARLMRLDEGWRTEEVQAADDIFSLQRRLGMRAHG
jgi:regulator of CtrA degradation